ncbi:MAG: fatty acid kinase fatty acid binding subunit [Thermoleophilaceae bacterium]|nr:fatty acid kinase fatty acid binding subunit [Thermoleophilaceae bacterium]
MTVALVTDTTHYLPRQMVAAKGLHEVSLYVKFEGRQIQESELLDNFDSFYASLRTAQEMPTTSQPSIGDFLAVWEPLLRDGDDVVSVHLASGISGTYDSALQAKARLVQDGLDEARLCVIDAQTGAGGTGMMLLAGAAAVQAGGDVEAVAGRLRAAREGLKIWFVVDTLEYLRRGGRIGAAAALLGSALKIKPILTFETEITPVERVRTAARAFERMGDYMSMRKEDGADGWVIQHVQAPEVAERLVERGREVFGSEPLFVSEIGPVIGAHVGPGLIGFGALPRTLLT